MCWVDSAEAVLPGVHAIRIGYEHSSNCVLKESGASLPLTRLLRGIEPSGCCCRSKRNVTASRAVARSPSATSPVHASYRSRENTSRYEPKKVLFGSPPDTAWPPGAERLPPIAPETVLSPQPL